MTLTRETVSLHSHSNDYVMTLSHSLTRQSPQCHEVCPYTPTLTSFSTYVASQNFLESQNFLGGQISYLFSYATLPQILTYYTPRTTSPPPHYTAITYILTQRSRTVSLNFSHQSNTFPHLTHLQQRRVPCSTHHPQTSSHTTRIQFNTPTTHQPHTTPPYTPAVTSFSLHPNILTTT